MASYSSSAVRKREKKLRTKYRKKIWIVAIIMLIIGLVAGYLLCLKFNDRIMDRTVDAAPEATPQIVYVTPQPAEADDLEENADEEEFYNNLVNEADSEGDMDYAAEDAEETTDGFDEDIIDFESFSDSEADIAEEEEPADADEEEALTALMMNLPQKSEAEAEAPAVEAEAEEPVVEAEAEAPAVEAEAEAPAVEAEAEAPVVEAEAEAPAVEAEAEAEEPAVEAEAEAPAVEAEAEEPVVEAPAEPIIVPYGETKSITTQILLDGSARRDTSSTEYETLNLDLKIDAYKDFDYFERNYGSTYNLQGGTAAVEFDLTLKDYGGVVEIVPQNFLLITLRGEKEEDFNQGYQLMDTEIAGKTGIVVTSNNTATLYKRYPYNAEMGDMRYLVVTTYNDGVETEYWFDIVDPNPAPPIVIAQELVMGSNGEEVKQLQEKLIEMGLLNDVADGKFGKNTMEAIKKAQEQLGLEQTGTADQDFIIALFK